MIARAVSAGRVRARTGRVTLPRAIYEDSVYLATRSCSRQQLLLRPDAETNNAVHYCLTVAAHRYKVEVIDFIALSNHVQYVFYDPHGNAPEFCGYFHRLLAKCMNVLRGRRENFFSSEPLSLVLLEERSDVIGEAAYVAANAVGHALVAHASEWPGARGLDALLTGEPIRATRPTFFFAEDGDMPAEVTLRVAVPEALGDRETFIAELRRRISVLEQEAAAERAALGKPFLGREAVLRESWQTFPPAASQERPRGDISPTIAARDEEVRLAAIERRLIFIAEYREARKAMLAGTPIPFPPGTYWLVRFAGHAVAAATPKFS